MHKFSLVQFLVGPGDEVRVPRGRRGGGDLDHHAGLAPCPTAVCTAESFEQDFSESQAM